MTTDEEDYQLLTLPQASLRVFAAPTEQQRNPGQAEIRIWGNRQGMASLASILLYLHSNRWRREFLSVTGLHFVHREGDVSLTLRLVAETTDGHLGRIHRIDRASQFEWDIEDEDELLKLVLLVHNLASSPWHEYDIVPFDEYGDAIVHFRLTDAMECL